MMIIWKRKKFRNIGIFTLLILFFSGCANIQKPTPIEKTQKEKIQKIEKIYRPQGKKPSLPVLSKKSDLKTYIRYAIYNNPAVEKAFYKWKESVEILPAYRYAPDLQFSLEAQITSGMMDDILPPLMVMPGIMASYPAKSKIYFAAYAMGLQAKKNYYIFQHEILKTSFAVKYIAYQYWIIQKRIQLTENIISILQTMESISIAKMKTNNLSLMDIIDIQMEIQKFQNILDNLKDYKHVLKIKFTQTLGINPYKSKVILLSPPSDLPFTNNDFKETEIWATVKKINPSLARLKTGIQQAEILIKLAYSQSKINFGVSLMQSVFSSMSLTEPLITLSIPWREKVAAEIKASRAGKKMAQAEFSSGKLELAAMLADSLFRWRKANREMYLYKTQLIPEITSVMQISKSSYKTGNLNIEKFLKANETYFNFYSNYFVSIGMREIYLNDISLIIAGIIPKGVNL